MCYFKVDNSFVFGMSWTVPSYAELNPICTINCTAQNDTFDCPEEKMEIAELGCGEIYHKAHGPFQVTILFNPLMSN